MQQKVQDEDHRLCSRLTRRYPALCRLESRPTASRVSRTLGCAEDFAGFIQEHGVDHYPFAGMSSRLWPATPAGVHGDGRHNPIKSILAVRKMIAPIVMTYKRWRLNDGKREFDLVELVRAETARRSGPASRGRWA